MGRHKELSNQVTCRFDNVDLASSVKQRLRDGFVEPVFAARRYVLVPA